MRKTNSNQLFTEQLFITLKSHFLIHFKATVKRDIQSFREVFTKNEAALVGWNQLKFFIHKIHVFGGVSYGLPAKGI